MKTERTGFARSFRGLSRFQRRSFNLRVQSERARRTRSLKYDSTAMPGIVVVRDQRFVFYDIFYSAHPQCLRVKISLIIPR